MVGYIKPRLSACVLGKVTVYFEKLKSENDSQIDQLLFFPPSCRKNDYSRNKK